LIIYVIKDNQDYELNLYCLCASNQDLMDQKVNKFKCFITM